MQDKFKVGDSISLERSFSRDEVQQFAKLSGDSNPIHLDEDFASESLFKKPIVHGILVSSLFSGIIASDLPGPGSIYLHQELNFKKPIFHNQKFFAKVEIVNIRNDKPIFELKTTCIDEEGNLLLDGKAVILLKK